MSVCATISDPSFLKHTGVFLVQNNHMLVLREIVEVLSFMKLIVFCLLAATVIFCFYYFLLGLMHLESLLLSGAILFTIIFLMVRLLTWHRHNKE
ncbi:hypothetical protein SAMN02982927_01474 [Sporolactobacillus nakayamae]|uniref:Uncharacterized protein n=2 Tax=Sporolactobacillus nakayamae TaxID=269670 RepID=A0A1I2RDE3_9BACL|nr:hypothetical protein SAMN02982927_01474 [Sporolactobacillus nakayamae]